MSYVNKPSKENPFAAVRERERLRRQTRNELLAQRERILAKIKAMYLANPDPDLLKSISEFERDTSWLDRPQDPMTKALLDAGDPNKRYVPRDFGTMGDPGRIKTETPPKRQHRLVAFYTRLVRKAGNRGVHRADDHGFLPQGGAAVSGLPADGVPPGGEPDAGSSAGTGRSRP